MSRNEQKRFLGGGGLTKKNPHHPTLKCSPAERFSKWSLGAKPRRGSRGGAPEVKGYGHQWRIQEWGEIYVNDEATERGFTAREQNDQAGVNLEEVLTPSLSRKALQF